MEDETACGGSAMRDGQCSKCASERVYTSTNGIMMDTRLVLYIKQGKSWQPTKHWVTYLCVDCGYYENYLSDPDILTQIRDAAATLQWKKVD